jgi:hypothetical protein
MPAARKRILFVGGSLNQTTMVHAVARELGEFHAAFTPFYDDGVMGSLARRGLLDFTILAGQARRATLGYLGDHGLVVDEGGRLGGYDLVVSCSDLLVPGNLRRTPLVLVQEGMTDPEDWRYRLVKGLGLPRYLANTSMTGLSHAYRAFCVASHGFRDLFIRKGVAPERIEVTGIPNFDDSRALLANDFPLKDYVLGATSCLRETLKPENRAAFIKKCLAVAGDRPLVFKLHPNENVARSTAEIRALAPRARIFSSGHTGHMVANARALVTKYSSVVFLALALDKEVHADIPIETLRRLLPIQNGGASAWNIAEVCRRHLN